jgi:hypothetical protein
MEQSGQTLAIHFTGQLSKHKREIVAGGVTACSSQAIVSVFGRHMHDGTPFRHTDMAGFHLSANHTTLCVPVARSEPEVRMWTGIALPSAPAPGVLALLEKLASQGEAGQHGCGVRPCGLPARTTLCKICAELLKQQWCRAQFNGALACQRLSGVAETLDTSTQGMAWARCWQAAQPITQ